jgi:hypothetical protein
LLIRYYTTTYKNTIAQQNKVLSSYLFAIWKIIPLTSFGTSLALAKPITSVYSLDKLKKNVLAQLLRYCKAFQKCYNEGNKAIRLA